MTSYLFPEARFSHDRLRAVCEALGNDTERLVIDLSCRRTQGKWMVAMNKWQTLTGMEVNQGANPIDALPDRDEANVVIQNQSGP